VLTGSAQRTAVFGVTPTRAVRTGAGMSAVTAAIAACRAPDGCDAVATELVV
jgi:hypothetical protein